jgi:hypothetical protein
LEEEAEKYHDLLEKLATQYVDTQVRIVERGYEVEEEWPG